MEKNILWQELTRGMPDGTHIVQILFRLVAAVLAGAIIGFERQRAGKSAGLRTHILVAMGSCLFVLVGGAYGMSADGVSRVMQGIATGIGFIGAGAIIKLSADYHIRGLTTSAGIWITAAIGICTGLGMVGIAMIASVLTLLVLTVVRKLEHKEDDTRPPTPAIEE